jgi:hypothetical protein
MTRASVVVRLAGGLGNQLFQYAFGRALASRNNATFQLDAVSGFPRDPYNRNYALGNYNLVCGFTSLSGSFATPMGRLCKRVEKFRSQWLPLSRRPYVTEDNHQRWNREISNLQVTRPTYFEGYWQHEEYFRDIRHLLLEELTLSSNPSDRCSAIADRIPADRGVAIHVRCLRHAPAGVATEGRLEIDPSYYDRAIAMVSERISNPVLFVFADDPEWARRNVRWPPQAKVLDGVRPGHEDLWLMSRCRGFIVGNSTFSWWGAWLSRSKDKCVIAPRSAVGIGIRSVPPEWTLL